MSDIDPALVGGAADAVFAEYQQVYQERLGHPVDPEDLPDRYRHRVHRTHGALYGRAVARKRYRCDGHMASERHWIEAGATYVASALPPDHPDIGNVGWWHHRFCMECAPAEYAVAEANQ